MRQLSFNRAESLRNLMVIGIVCSALAVVSAHAQVTPPNTAVAAPSAGAGDDGALTREEILALFQREARAAYQMNREACASLPADEQKVCLAKARLQFDEDMRYAQRRADQGY